MSSLCVKILYCLTELLTFSLVYAHKVKVRWYYRPEEAIGGRRPFHGAKELFLSDHYDIQSAHTIEGKCIVHSFKNYTKLENVGAEDYFCRFEYKAATGNFTPDRVAVYVR